MRYVPLVKRDVKGQGILSLAPLGIEETEQSKLKRTIVSWKGRSPKGDCEAEHEGTNVSFSPQGL